MPKMLEPISEDTLPANSNRESFSKSHSGPVVLVRVLFALLGAVSVAIWWSPLASSFGLALRDEQYTHILLILPISAALIFVDWKSTQLSSGLNATISAPGLAIAIAVTAVARSRVLPLAPDVRLSIDMLAFVMWLIAAFVLCFGTAAFRRALFPLCFLFWMVPLPQFVLNPVVSFLQRGSAAAAHLLFLIAGIPVAQRGVLVHIPGLTLEVAPECSSIRSSLMLLVTTMVLAHLFLRSFWRKALLVALAIPLSVAKNGLRIFVLGMLATRVDPGFLTGRLHREGGIIYFLIALAATFLFVWMLHRSEEKQSELGTGRSL
jgi:exosortase